MTEVRSAFSDCYTEEYCLQLEAAYGEGMMSEGGPDGIEHMFEGVPLFDKTALEIGSGLGAAAVYLARTKNMRITGLEVNEWMCREAGRRVGPDLSSRVDFVLASKEPKWPFADSSFDLVYSKGVLTHVKDKETLFRECRRVVKNRGLFVITDCLCNCSGDWGRNIGRLIELEGLELHPETEIRYTTKLKLAGFSLLDARDDSGLYEKYNLQIVERLRDPLQVDLVSARIGKEWVPAAIEGYFAIAEALKTNELRVLRFIAIKSV